MHMFFMWHLEEYDENHKVTPDRIHWDISGKKKKKNKERWGRKDEII